MITRREMNATLAAAVTAFLTLDTGPFVDAEVRAEQGSRRGYGRGRSPVRTLMEEPLEPMPNPVVSVITLSVAPGAISPPHEHTGPVFAYILEGEIENQVEPNPPKTYKAGDYFYEPPMHVHKMLRNLSKTKTATLLIFQVGEKDKQFTIGVK